MTAKRKPFAVAVPIHEDVPVGQAYAIALDTAAQAAEKHDARMHDSVSIRRGHTGDMDGAADFDGYLIFEFSGEVMADD